MIEQMNGFVPMKSFLPLIQAKTSQMILKAFGSIRDRRPGFSSRL